MAGRKEMTKEEKRKQHSAARREKKEKARAAAAAATTNPPTVVAPPPQQPLTPLESITKKMEKLDLDKRNKPSKDLRLVAQTLRLRVVPHHQRYEEEQKRRQEIYDSISAGKYELQWDDEGYEEQEEKKRLEKEKKGEVEMKTVVLFE